MICDLRLQYCDSKSDEGCKCYTFAVSGEGTCTLYSKALQTTADAATEIAADWSGHRWQPSSECSGLLLEVDQLKQELQAAEDEIKQLKANK